MENSAVPAQTPPLKCIDKRTVLQILDGTYIHLKADHSNDITYKQSTWIYRILRNSERLSESKIHFDCFFQH